MADDNNIATDECSVNLFIYLPAEVISLILRNPQLSFADVVSFGSTCKRFHEITSDNELWKAKLLTRWPCLLQSAVEKDIPLSWLDCCKQLFPLPAQVNDIAMGLSAKCFPMDEVSYYSFQPLKDLSTEGGLNHHLVSGTLRDIVSNKEENKCLTVKYYAKKALRCIHHTQMKTEWRTFLSLPVEQQSLLEGAMLFEQWYNPIDSLDCEKIRSEVTDIANQARRKLTKEHPFYYGKNEGAVEMTSDQYNEVLDAVNKVMYKEMGFQGNSDDYYNPNNSFMSKVLTTRHGIPITLCILYEAVVRRLGIVLRPVNFPGHFLLLWNHTSDGFRETETNQFIDAFKAGYMMTTAEAIRKNPGIGRFRDNAEFFRPCAPTEVFKRMAANLMNINEHSQSNLYRFYGEELQVVLNPEDFEAVIGCVQVYIQQHVHSSEALEILREIRPQTNREASTVRSVKQILEGIVGHAGEQREKLSQAKRRAESLEVLYSVGMVMRHLRYHYACVIYGWDLVCKLSRTWQIQMGIDQLPNKEQQPFYNVLVTDSSSRYVAQENLVYVGTAEPITHPEVGRYFEEFTGKCYLPNEQLSLQYPDDMAVTTEKATELYM